jgi:hypothetical protein
MNFNDIKNLKAILLLYTFSYKEKAFQFYAGTCLLAEYRFHHWKVVLTTFKATSSAEVNSPATCSWSQSGSEMSEGRLSNKHSPLKHIF